MEDFYPSRPSRGIQKHGNSWAQRNKTDQIDDEARLFQGSTVKTNQQSLNSLAFMRVVPSGPPYLGVQQTFFTQPFTRRRGSPMSSTLLKIQRSGLESWGWVSCVVLLGKTLTLTVPRSTQMQSAGEFIAGSNILMDQQNSRNTPSHLVPRSPNKLRHSGPDLARRRLCHSNVSSCVGILKYPDPQLVQSPIE